MDLDDSATGFIVNNRFAHADDLVAAFDFGTCYMAENYATDVVDTTTAAVVPTTVAA